MVSWILNVPDAMNENGHPPNQGSSDKYAVKNIASAIPIWFPKIKDVELSGSQSKYTYCEDRHSSTLFG